MAVPNLWLMQHSGAPEDPAWGPARVYYLADSRDYRPRPKGQPYATPTAGINDGWHVGWGNKVFLGTRHFGYANVMYLDGHVTRDNQAHPVLQWNMDYDTATGQARSSQWRCSTFATYIRAANITTQGHVMPVLSAVGWEYLLDGKDVIAR